jgi:hypothetical protein
MFVIRRLINVDIEIADQGIERTSNITYVNFLFHRLIR